MIEQDALFSLIASGDLLSVNGLEGLENGEDQSGVGSVNVCEHCNKIFLKNSNYQTHLRTHTGEKPFVCCICTKQFARADYLKAHLISHSGARPYTCGICEKTFTHVSSLNTHIRIHTGERPYACHVCPRSFTKSSDLQRHLDIHREKLFTCFMCDKRFARVITLKKHLERCNGSLEDVSPSSASPWKMPCMFITGKYKKKKYKYEEDVDELDSDEDYEPFRRRRNFHANSAVKNGDHRELEKADQLILNPNVDGNNVFVEIISKEHNENISSEMSHESPNMSSYAPIRNTLAREIGNEFLIGNGRTLFDSSTSISLPLQTFPLEIGMLNIAQFQ